jgi:hypothetical protein
MELVFRKTGKQIKQAVQSRRQQLQARLNKRNQVLDEFLEDTKKVRSYVVRSSKPEYYGHGRGEGYVLFSQDDISSEEKEELSQLCNRIFEIEQELHRLALVQAHLDDKQMLELSLDDLIGYGFTVGEGIESEGSDS